MRLLFVCSGNTCRSPMAAALAEKYCGENGMPAEIKSAGTGAFPGMPASEGAAAAMKSRGLDLSGHRSKPVTRELLDWADFVIPMTPCHAQALLAAGCKPEKLRAFPEPVPDPFGGNTEVYEACAARMDALLPALLEGIAHEA